MGQLEQIERRVKNLERFNRDLEQFNRAISKKVASLDKTSDREREANVKLMLELQAWLEFMENYTKNTLPELMKLLIDNVVKEYLSNNKDIIAAINVCHCNHHDNAGKEQ